MSQHQRPPWPATTSDAAPFSIEMVTGSHPDRPRLPFMAKQGWIAVPGQIDAAPFSIEMVAGTPVDRRRPFRQATAVGIAIPPDIASTTVKFRKTLSGIGSHTGGRQVHGN